MDLKCTGVQIASGIGLRIGKCTDSDGQNYIDWGVSVGPQGGLMVFWGKDQRSSDLEFEARAHIGMLVAGEASSVNSNIGAGIGLGAGLGVRGLQPYGVRTRPAK